MTELQKQDGSVVLQSFDINDQLPDLHKDGKVMAVDLSSTYWSPEKEGETKKGYYQRIETTEYEDPKTGDTVELPCVIFISQDKEGNLTTIRNGSVRLVSAIQDAEAAGRIRSGSPIQITYLGKQKNKKDTMKSHSTWSLKPILVTHQ